MNTQERLDDLMRLTDARIAAHGPGELRRSRAPWEVRADVLGYALDTIPPATWADAVEYAERENARIAAKRTEVGA